jgi:hypothetical protein
LFGELYGCHTCGSRVSGGQNFVLDHQPPIALNPSGLIPYRGYPQCHACGLPRIGGRSQPHEIRTIILRDR